MEYEFLRDVTGQVRVRMSMDHEAVGHWFNEEVKNNLSLLDEVEAAVRDVKGSERQWQRVGHEYTLWLDEEEVMIRANLLALEDEGMEEGMNYYNEESLSFCGVEDFLAVIAAYRQFLQQYGSKG
ncbi:protein YacL [Pantoea sp. LMR881]|uniref:protein YacL n=1 Tax=Pantoea sp. LMR881 TaxID=3014336 RepID=UPI0022AFC54E|nr:protein YacL [Pantoea sp. LMR881]MCZ4059270.1 protein YacL [Pantoea sp. LMR881]